ncbi:hypothetical protein [Hyphomicrobium sp. 99]|uniref:hypothetical protein n=1 Tax=Hyphomicrobium sp. 99 TaxID=1163419 RepID=UPI0018CF741E|nr:hypothetical protein [Hyphomicrobium sp. 99]
MKAATATLCIAAAVAACLLGAPARAEDMSLPSPSQDTALSAKLSRDINAAAGIAVEKPSADVEAQIRDLEASRAAVDERKTPAISLSVSGWVSQQVQYNVKQ